MATHADTGAPSAGMGARGGRTDARLAGLIFFTVGAWFLTAIMLGASIAPAYDYGAGAISDLGVISQTALLFNATLIAIGILNAVGGYLLSRWHGGSWVAVPFVLAGLGAAGAGLFPLSTGAPHSLFALAAFVFFNVEAVGVAFVVRGSMRVISALAGLIGLVFVVLMIIGDAGNPEVFGPIGHGGAERMITYPAMLWLLGLGGSLIAQQPDGG